MAVTNSVQAILQGFGISGLNGSASSGTTIAADAVTVTCSLPSTSPVNYGYVRCKVSGVDGSHGIVSAVFTATDSTTTIYIPEPVAITSGSNGRGIEITKNFTSDLNLLTFVVVVTGAAGISTCTVNLEVYGNEAAGGP